VGPRQVGKTVILLQIAADLIREDFPAVNITYFDWSDDRLTEIPSPRDVVKFDPPGLVSDVPRIFLLDEIGRFPKWDLWLKQAVDGSRHRFVVTDSSSAILRGGGRESGLGRWYDRELEPLTFDESLRLQGIERTKVNDVLEDPFERYTALGGFPSYLDSRNYDDVHGRIRQDIAERALLRDLMTLDVDTPRMRDLFVYICQESGGLFDPSSRARDMDADPRAVRKWCEVLLDTMLVRRLPAWTLRGAPQLRAKSKLYAVDHGVVFAFANAANPIHDPAVRARAFETMVFRQLRAVSKAVRGELYFLRKDDDLEVDFLLRTGSTILPIEVTSSESVTPRKKARLRAAMAFLNVKRGVVIHAGRLGSSDDSIDSIACREFALDPTLALKLELP
jgi:predicted AAA+ superfamily ATPase